MTSAAKTWVTIIIVIILLVLGWLWYSNSAGVQTGAPVGDMSLPAQSSADNSASMSATNDTSNSGISQDMTAINGQVSAMDSDSASIDQGMNSAY